MKVHEIAKAVGMEASAVAAELGLGDGQGVHLKNVEDAQAQAYITAKGGDAGAGSDRNTPKVDRKARFWSPHRRNVLPKNPEDKRNHIGFDDWVYECGGDSEDAKFLRRVDIRDRLRIFEVLPKPYADAGRVADFMRYLETLVFTGESPADGPSREGRDSVVAMLFPDMLAVVPKEVKNSPRGLTRAVANLVSLNVDSFGTEA